MENMDLNLFVERALLLSECSYFNSGYKLSSKVQYREDGTTTYTGEQPERESIESFGMRIRIFIAKDEPLRFDRILKYLIRKDVTRKKIYEEYLENYKRVMVMSPMVVKYQVPGKERTYSATDFMWDMLYGDYFHVEKDRRERMKELAALLGNLPYFMALTKLTMLGHLIIGLGNYLLAKKVVTR